MSSSSSKPHWIYDVFLNFRGEDTRNGFVSDLHAALSNAGLNPFIDDMIPKGEALPTELSRAIEGSQMSIVVFSENYAASSWCLYELEKIMECQRTIGQLVLPVFYYVDPSHVRHQKGVFGDAFDKLAAKFSESGEIDRVSGWRRALTDAANLTGWTVPVPNFRGASDTVNRIVDEALGKIDTPLPITDHPVGLESRVQEVIQFLKIESSVQDVIQFLENKSARVQILGIWGMGGSGKTTIAKAIYNKIHRNFREKNFIENIKDVWEKDIRGQIGLQKQLSDIHKREKLKIHSIEQGKIKIKERLWGKMALLVFDDVDKSEQLNALCVNGMCEWIGSGSLIIVTTRDLGLLKRLEADHIYKMTEMYSNESLELFSWHAFKKESPRDKFIELSKRVVEYCEGLPLALVVLGSYLYDRTELEWNSVLSKLQAIPHGKVQEKLRISFDGLEDYTMQEIFLDICCFFIGKDRAYVTQILNGCDLYADIGITVLIERSLIRVEKGNKLGMHALLRDMGREIVRCSSPKEPPKEPGERSRLWSHKEALDVLTQNTGTEAIQGLALKSQGSGVRFEADAILKMNRLRLLQFDNVNLTGDYGYLSKNLKWVSWQGFRLKYMPDSFNQGKVVVFDLKHSHLNLVWKEPKLLECLKILNLSHSRSLTKTPNFSYLPSLEELILEDCPSLTEVHQSIGDLNNILLINLKDCTSLSNLPRELYKLKALKTLILSGCSKIDKLEEDIVQMESLTYLIAETMAEKQVPFSILRSKSIGYISIRGYEGLATSVLPSLILVWTSLRTNPLSHIGPFGSLSPSLGSLCVPNSSLGDLSMPSQLSKLRCLQVQCCSGFQSRQDLERILGDVYGVNFTKQERTSQASKISEHSLGSFLIGMGGYHQVFDTLSKTIKQELVTSRSGNVCLPGDNYPHWLTHRDEGHSVCFQVPQVSDCSMKGMILCVVYPRLPESMAAECRTAVVIINYTKCTIQLYKRNTGMSFNDEDWQGILSNLGPDDEVKILVAFGRGLTVNSTAVYLIYGESVDQEKELSQTTKKRKLSNSELK